MIVTSTNIVDIDLVVNEQSFRNNFIQKNFPYKTSFKRYTFIDTQNTSHVFEHIIIKTHCSHVHILRLMGFISLTFVCFVKLISTLIFKHARKFAPSGII